jgi:uncharacterized protein (TIGR02646 family)
MRYIKKQNSPPALLTEWIQKNKNDTNFGYDLLRGNKNKKTIDDINECLLKEQYYLCAYTGISLNTSRFHIEHLKPQKHCNRGEDVDYENLVACYPEPNRPQKCPFGAHAKDNWPSPSEVNNFVSPLNPNCETKFKFGKDGSIVGLDKSAIKTIEKLKLDHPKLIDLRKSQLIPLLKLKRGDAAKRLSKIDTPNDGKLEEFCFAKKQVLQKHVQKLEAIIQNKQKKP